MFVLHRLHDGDPHFLGEAAGQPLGVLFVQAFQLEPGVDSLLDCLPELWAFGYRGKAKKRRSLPELRRSRLPHHTQSGRRYIILLDAVLSRSFGIRTRRIGPPSAPEDIMLSAPAGNRLLQVPGKPGKSPSPNRNRNLVDTPMFATTLRVLGGVVPDLPDSRRCWRRSSPYITVAALAALPGIFSPLSVGWTWVGPALW